MKISVLTIFPDFFPPALAEGMIRAAREKGRLEVAIVGLRDFTDDSHRTTDDYPFGGGAGMIMKIEPIDRALASLGVGEKGARAPGVRVALTSPQGRSFTQDLAIEYSGLEHLVLICGRYKGVDERVSERLVDEELSLGDFVLSGGEPAALCVVDAVARLLPGVVGSFDSVESDSFHSGLLDAAYYTRPATYRGWSVPEVLLSGHHANIGRARREDSLRRTRERRPDLLARASLSAADRRYVAGLEPAASVAVLREAKEPVSRERLHGAGSSTAGGANGLAPAPVARKTRKASGGRPARERPAVTKVAGRKRGTPKAAAGAGLRRTSRTPRASAGSGRRKSSGRKG